MKISPLFLGGITVYSCEAWVQLQKPRIPGSLFMVNRGQYGHDYTLSNNCGPNTSLLSDSEIHELLAKRLNARLSRNFAVADSIRSQLINSGVYVEDDLKEWRADGETYDSREADIFKKFGPKGHDYQLYADCGINNSKLSEQEIDELLAARLKAKISRNYGTSEKIENELINAGVFVNDSKRQFRTDGKPFNDFIPLIKDSILPKIVHCNTFQQILDLQDANKNEIMPVHVSYCWNQCTRIVQNPTERRRLNYSPGLLYPLIRLAFSMAERFDARSLAFTAHGIAKISTSSRMNVDPALWRTIEESAMKLETFDAKGISNLLWAFAKVDYQAPKLFDKLANQAMSMLNLFPSRSIATMLWAYAKQGQAAPALFKGFSPIIINKLDSFNSQSLADVLWAYTKLGSDDPKLFDAIAGTAIETLDTFKPQRISILLLSYSKVAHDVPEFFDAAGDVLVEKINFVTTRNVVHTLSAYAKKGHKFPKLFEAVAHRSLDFNACTAYEISTILWSYSTLGYNAPSFFDDIAETTIANLDTFEAKEITSVLRSYAIMGHDFPKLFDAVAQKTNDKTYDFTSEEQRKLIWAYEQLGHVAPQL